MTEKRKPGRPVTHPPVKCLDTGFVTKTYTEMAKHVGGDRVNIMRCCTGLQKKHHGFRFEHTDGEVSYLGPDLVDVICDIKE